MNGSEEFDDLYAVVLKFEVDPNYAPIPGMAAKRCVDSNLYVKT